MRILVDASSLGPRFTGIQNYSVSLLKELTKIDDINDYVIFLHESCRNIFDLNNRRTQIENIPDNLPGRYFWHYFWYNTGLGHQIMSKNPDLFLSLNHALPPFLKCKTAAIIYDVIPLVIKNSTTAYYRLKFKRELRYTLKRADYLIAISEHTKQDLVNLFGVKPDAIKVIYPGYDKLFTPLNDQEKIRAVKNKYKIDSDYILFTGTLQPNKNLPRLIEAFANLKETKHVSHNLVIAGKDVLGSNVVRKIVSQKKMENEIIFTGYVSGEELPVLMNGAVVFVFPSLYEGFGIPPLEAMACGTPVITSNVSSLPEVVGDAGLLIDPLNIDGLTNAMYKVITNDSLRETMRQKGLERVKIFSWSNSAKELLSIINDSCTIQTQGGKA